MTQGAGLFVIQNPAAGPRKPERLRRRIEESLRALGVSFEHVYTREPGHGQELARQALADGYRRVAVAGGDGTVLEGVSALAGTGAALALLPVGTGNQLAANLGLPRNLRRSVEVAVSGVVRKIDVGMINGQQPFTCVAGAGFDAAVVRPQSHVKRRLGYLAYVHAAAAAAFAPKRSMLTITIDGEEVRGRGIGVEVTNMPALSAPGFPRPIPIVPDGQPDDGRLEVCMLAVETTFEVVVALTSILTRRYGRNPKLRYFSGREISVDADPPLPLQADGELLGTTPFTVTVRPRALSVIVPEVQGR